MNLIFLGVDGVLNTKESIKEGIHVDEELVKKLSYITEETNSLVVLTCSWRAFFKEIDNYLIPNPKIKEAVVLYDLFDKYGIELHDRLGNHFFKSREIELNEYLENNQGISNYVIIDSNSYSFEHDMNKHFIKTNYSMGGLKDRHIEKAINILSPQQKVKIK